MVTYRLIEETLWKQEVGNYKAFGVAAYKIAEGETIVLSHFSDIFLNREEARRFVELCGQMELDVTHLPDVIEDMISK